MHELFEQQIDRDNADLQADIEAMEAEIARIQEEREA